MLGASVQRKNDESAKICNHNKSPRVIKRLRHGLIGSRADSAEIVTGTPCLSLDSKLDHIGRSTLWSNRYQEVPNLIKQSYHAFARARASVVF